MSSRQFAQFAQYPCGFREFGVLGLKSRSEGGLRGSSVVLAGCRLAWLEKQTPGGCPGAACGLERQLVNPPLASVLAGGEISRRVVLIVLAKAVLVVAPAGVTALGYRRVLTCMWGADNLAPFANEIGFWRSHNRLHLAEIIRKNLPSFTKEISDGAGL